MEKKEVIKFAPYDHVLKYVLPIIPRRVKPNHLTFIRLIFSPVLMLALVLEMYETGLILFIVLAITDMLDGSMARIRNQITDWGKIWDPIADKLLIGTVVVVLLLKINLVLTVFLLAFEIAFITGGTIMKMNHIDVQANVWGKIKMNFHAFGGGFLILGFFLDLAILVYIAELLLYVSLFFAAMSLIRKGI